MTERRMLTMREAAAVLGIRGARPGRTALAAIRARERQRGRTMLVSVGTGSRHHFRVGAAALRHYFADVLREAPSEAEQAIRQLFRRFEDRLARIEAEAEDQRELLGLIVANLEKLGSTFGRGRTR